MGNVLSYLLPCLSKNKNIPLSKIIYSELEDDSFKFKGTILEIDFFVHYVAINPLKFLKY